jgi:sec-independent protein translocase protein TatA
MTPTLPPALFNLGNWEIVVVLLLILVLFGSRLPQAMKSLGSSIREFKKGVKEGSGSPEEDPPARIHRDREDDRSKDRDAAAARGERRS